MSPLRFLMWCVLSISVFHLIKRIMPPFRKRISDCSRLYTDDGGRPVRGVSDRNGRHDAGGRGLGCVWPDLWGVQSGLREDQC
ncbi:hypothetical protein AOLI_G00084780 [Acnodon oligacanthus]